MGARLRAQWLVTAGILSALVAACGSSSAPVADAPGPRLGPNGAAFYTPPSPLPKGRPGDLIWVRPVQAPKHASAWRILYLSTTGGGARVAVSGLVIAPRGKAPSGGRKVLAWAHGTVGGARSCAPSEAPNPAQNLVNYYSYGSSTQIDVGVPALTSFLKAGYVIAATDYQGLGTPGVHQYVVGGTEAHNVLDAVKAARQIKPAHAGGDVVALGWSQGGGAALWVGQDAAYGRPLRVLGSAGLAPATDLGPEFAGLTPAGPASPSSPSHNAALALNVFRGLHAAYPALSLSQVLSAAGLSAIAGYNVQCNDHLGDVIQESVPDPATLFKRPVPKVWLDKMYANSPGSVSTVAPVLVMQGTADTVVNPNGTSQYVRQACRFHKPVEYSRYAGATHQTIPVLAQKQYLGWIADRFKGKPAPSNC